MNEASHLTDWTLEQLAEGTLPADELPGARRHLEACERCAAELEGYRALYVALSELPRFAPSPVFNDAVMARVRVSPQPSPLWAWLQGWVPATRRGRALLAGALVAPGLPILALLGWILLSPSVSLGMVWEWVTGGVRSAVQVGLTWVMEWGVSSGLFGWLRSAFDAAQSVPLDTLGLLLGVLAVAIPLSAWSLYRLVRTPMGNAYAS